jgi:acyl carrier protein
MPAITTEQAVQAVAELLDERGRPVDVDAGTRLTDLGLDSLDLAELSLALEEIAGARMDPASAETAASVGDLSRLRFL